MDIEETNSLYQLADEKDRKMISNYTYQIRKPRDFYIQFWNQIVDISATNWNLSGQ